MFFVKKTPQNYDSFAFDSPLLTLTQEEKGEEEEEEEEPQKCGNFKHLELAALI